MERSAKLPRDAQANFAVAFDHLPVIGGLLILAVPTVVTLGSETWTSESGAQGPIVLATGAWLISRIWPEISRSTFTPAPTILTVCLFLLGLLGYVFGRAYDFLTAEVAGLYILALSVASMSFGWSAMRRHWFPFAYLAIVIPPPAFLVVQLTAPLKHLVAQLAILCVAPLDVPVVRDGVTIIVGPYQLLVEDACSGMNSLFSLLCLSMFYLYMTRRASVFYSVFMMSIAGPVAILANVIRIVMLILITYFFGDAVGQSFLHYAAGILVFSLALGLIMLIDRLACGPVRVIYDEERDATSA